MDDTLEIIASAIANARGGRRGMPPVSNILDMLPEELRDALIDDAEAVLKALSDAGRLIQQKE